MQQLLYFELLANTFNWQELFKKKAHQSLKHLVMAHGLCDVEPDGATTTTADRQWQLQQELHGSLEDYQ